MTDPVGRHALVLAGGASRRFGGAKLTALWRGEPLIRSSVRTALLSQVETVSVITGAEPAAVSEALAALGDPRLSLVHAPDWDEGMAASLRRGVASLRADARAVVIFLGDMPCIPPSLADRLLDAIEAGAPAAVVRSQHGPAHPVAFSAAVFPELMRLSGDRGARALLQTLADAVVAVACDDPGVIFDIDHPGDLAIRGNAGV